MLFLSSGPERASHHILFAHGAGAPMTSPFMEIVAANLSTNGIRVHRFEFEYMSARRTTGKRRPPPKAEVLMPAYLEAVQSWAAQQSSPARLYIGGKSLGGRVASLVAGDLHQAGAIAGLVCLGYPFHPPGKPELPRTVHLLKLQCPTLIVQGTRDPFGTRAEIEGYELPGTINLHWASDGNHDLTPPARTRRTLNSELQSVANAVSSFMQSAADRS